MRLSSRVFACKRASAKEQVCTQVRASNYIALTTISYKASQLLAWPERPFSYGFVRKAKEVLK